MVGFVRVAVRYSAGKQAAQAKKNTIKEMKTTYFQVAMGQVERVNVTRRCSDLAHNQRRFVLGEVCLFLDALEEFATRHSAVFGE